MYPSFMQLSKNTNEILKCKMTPDGESITCAFFQFFDTWSIENIQWLLINFVNSILNVIQYLDGIEYRYFYDLLCI